MTRTISIGIFIEFFYYNQAYDDVLKFFNQQFPDNTLVTKFYILDGTPEDSVRKLEEFLNDFPSGERATISVSTTFLTLASKFFEERGLDIFQLSTGSASSDIAFLNNVLSYSYADKFSVMVFFLIFKDYQMCQIKILYDPVSPFNQTFFRKYREVFEEQARILGIPYSSEPIEEGKSIYAIQPKTFILILAADELLRDKYITPQFLANIPPECYIGMTVSNPQCQDIFGKIPAFVCLPFPINYTSTSQQVYDSLSPESKRIFFYFIFSFYDSLFVLNRFTATDLELNKQNYRNINVYDTSQPAWASNNLFNLEINRIPFGNFNLIFTKNSVVGKDEPLYLTYYQGGHMVLPQSNSVFLTAGFTPLTDNLIYYDYNPYYKFYRKKGKLLLTAFANDSTAFPPLASERVMIFGSKAIKQFVFKYDEKEFVLRFLERLLPLCGKLPQVNLTMSKQIIKEFVK